MARGQEMARACQKDDLARQPGRRLGAFMGALAKQGRDKLTLLLAPEVASLGAWIEQLVAESTGKLGRGDRARRPRAARSRRRCTATIGPSWW